MTNNDGVYLIIGFISALLRVTSGTFQLKTTNIWSTFGVVFLLIIQKTALKTSTTPSCSRPISAQKLWMNSVRGAVFSQLMLEMDFNYITQRKWIEVGHQVPGCYYYWACRAYRSVNSDIFYQIDDSLTKKNTKTTTTKNKGKKCQSQLCFSRENLSTDQNISASRNVTGPFL